MSAFTHLDIFGHVLSRVISLTHYICSRLSLFSDDMYISPSALFSDCFWRLSACTIMKVSLILLLPALACFVSPRMHISKMARSCATWGTGISGVTRFRQPSQHRIISNAPTCSSYTAICSISRSYRMNNISTTASPTSPLALLEVCSNSLSPIPLQSCQQYQESLISEGDTSVLEAFYFYFFLFLLSFKTLFYSSSRCYWT